MNSEDIKRLYDSAFPAIFAFVVKNSGKKEDAEDIFQDAMLVFYKRTKRADFELTSKPETFLYAVARNLWLKKLRSPRLVEVTSAAEAVLTVEDDLDEADFQALRERLYRTKFAELDSDCQHVIKLFLEGKTMKEIAKTLDYGSEGYAKKKKFTCKEKLFSLIKADAAFSYLSS